MKIKKSLLFTAFVLLGVFGSAIHGFAQEEVAEAVAAATEAAPPDEDYLALKAQYGETFDFFTTSVLWTLIAAGLVFIMHLGFASLEAGLTQSKNTVNILLRTFSLFVWDF